MKSSRLLVRISLVLFCLAIGAFLIGRYYIFAAYEYEPVRVEIPAGSTSQDVSTIMKDALGKSFGGKVALLWSLQGGSPVGSRGSYLVNPGDNALRVARTIAKGRQTPVRFTFNNMRLYTELAAKAGNVFEFDSLAFMEASRNTLSAKGYTPEEYSAAVLPDTYEFYWTDKPIDVIEKISQHRDRFWNSSRRDKAKALGLTPEQVHIIASIAEEESNRLDERPKVARLYINRLGKGMALQADPTLKFASKNFGVRRITHKMRDIDSPYNTYSRPGLPPGPIRIAEAATIDGVLDSPKHDYVFMCARSDFSGYHDFARTYDEHRINAARYHRALDARGIK